MDELDDPVILFFAKVGERLDDAIHNFKSGDRDAASRELERAVELCEQYPAYAMLQSAELGSSLQRVVHGCISNAIAKGRSTPKMMELLARVEAIARVPLH